MSYSLRQVSRNTTKKSSRLWKWLHTTPDVCFAKIRINFIPKTSQQSGLINGSRSHNFWQPIKFGIGHNRFTICSSGEIPKSGPHVIIFGRDTMEVAALYVKINLNATYWNIRPAIELCNGLLANSSDRTVVRKLRASITSEEFVYSYK